MERVITARRGPDLESTIHRDSKLWVEIKDDSTKLRLRLGIDDLPIIGAERKGDRGVLFVPAPGNHCHFTVVADPKTRRLTFHETMEPVYVIGGTRVSWRENAQPAMVMSLPHIERRVTDEYFLRNLRNEVERACVFLRQPRDFDTQGIVAVLPTPTAADFRAVSGTRFELQIAAFGPAPADAVWESMPGALFFTIGKNLKVVGMATLLEDERAVLIRYRDILAVLDRIIRGFSEPGSPPLDVLAQF